MLDENYEDDDENYAEGADDDGEGAGGLEARAAEGAALAQKRTGARGCGHDGFYYAKLIKIAAARG